MAPMTSPGLMAAAAGKGLAALGEELRAIEEDDAAGEKFPRFKKSDDATAYSCVLLDHSLIATWLANDGMLWRWR